MTYQEAAAFMVRTAKNLLHKTSHTDPSQIEKYSDYASIDPSLQGDVLAARDLGIMHGANTVFSRLARSHDQR